MILVNHESMFTVRKSSSTLQSVLLVLEIVCLFQNMLNSVKLNVTKSKQWKINKNPNIQPILIFERNVQCTFGTVRNHSRLRNFEGSIISYENCVPFERIKWSNLLKRSLKTLFEWFCMELSNIFPMRSHWTTFVI